MGREKRWNIFLIVETLNMQHQTLLKNAFFLASLEWRYILGQLVEIHFKGLTKRNRSNLAKPKWRKLQRTKSSNNKFSFLSRLEMASLINLQQCELGLTEFFLYGFRFIINEFCIFDIQLVLFNIPKNKYDEELREVVHFSTIFFIVLRRSKPLSSVQIENFFDLS